MSENNSCMDCKSNSHLKYTGLFYADGKVFCPHYPIKMSILNPDIIGGYVCDKYERVKITPIPPTVSDNPFNNNTMKDYFPSTGGMKVMGMFPLDTDLSHDEFMKKFKKELRKMGFKI